MEQRRIRITTGGVEVTATLNNSRTADEVWESLPIKGSGSTWGDEIYFRTPLQSGEDDGQEVVEMGALAYWPPGQAICLFWGPTPASRGDEIRPASAVNVIGQIEGDPTVLDPVRSGSDIVLEKA